MKISDFKELANIFAKFGYDLYLVGGSVRDYLLHSSFLDADCVSNASIEDIKKFLKVKSEYKNMSSAKFVYNGHEFDITTMRKESSYIDFRHPTCIEKVNSPKEEYERRDFTINALYMDKDEVIYDYCNGVEDLNNKIIRCIGNPSIRFKEDPLRILRAIRFASNLDFEIEEELKNAIKDNLYLLKNLKFIKIKEELSKFKLKGEDLEKLLISYDVDKVIPININKSLTKSISYINYDGNFINILNDIINKGSFINVVKIETKEELDKMLNNINEYKLFVNLLNCDTKLDNLYSQNIFVIILEFNDDDLSENIFIKDSKLYLKKNDDYIVKDINIKTKDEMYYKIDSKKQRNKLYYDYLVNLLKDL